MMHNTTQHNTSRLKPKAFLYRLSSAFIAFTFACNLILPPNLGFAQTILNLPSPGAMIMPSTAFTPPLIKGIIVHPENPLKFDFIIDVGDKKLDQAALRQEALKLMKYFMASVTLPQDDMWVNLSPYEKDRIVTPEFGVTEMGKDLLSQDYILKQLTASLMYPESELGQKFWQKVYAKAQSLYGTTNIPINTFNKVWIVPDKAVVHERKNSAFVVESHLKVMLEGDYLALQENLNNQKIGTDHLLSGEVKKIHDVSSDIVKEMILPEIEKEVNEGQAFANLRQIYNAEILAYWYKTALKESLLGQVYANKKKVKGVDVEDKEMKQKIYQQYLDAFKTGVYNYIKEDTDPVTQKTIPRKYFSGGAIAVQNIQSVDEDHMTRGQRLALGSTHAAGAVQIGMEVAGVRPGTNEDAIRGIIEESFQPKEQTPTKKDTSQAAKADQASLTDISETLNQLRDFPNDEARRTFLTDVTHLSQVAPLFSLGHLTRKDIEGKVVVARFAFEVQLDRTHPIYSARRVKDDARLRNVIDTIRFIMENGGRLVIIPGYNGRPPGRVVNNELSMAPVALRLTEILREEGIFTPDESIQMFTDHLVPSIDENYVPQNSFAHLAELKATAAQMPAHSVLMTESTRFTPLEDQANEPLAREIAALGDIFVSDPPAQDHRRNASNLAAQYAPVSVLGFSILKEVDFFADIRQELLKPNRKPFVLILAGSKVDTEVGITSKISVTEDLLKDMQSIDSVLVGGALAYPFILAETWQDIKEKLAAPDVQRRIQQIRSTPVENFENQLSAETKRIIAEEVRANETDQKNAKTQAWLLQEIFGKRFEDIKDLMGDSYISWTDIFDQLLIVQRIFNFIETRRSQGVNFRFETNIDHTIGNNRFVGGKVPEDTQTKAHPHKTGIPKGWAAGDIGPQTIARWKPILASAGTVVIAGPVGIAESEKFQNGSFQVAEAATHADKSIGAGGDTRTMLEDAGLVKKFTHASVAGGSSLVKIEGTEITPGVEAVFEQENALTFLSNTVAPRVAEQSQTGSPGPDNAALSPGNSESSDLQVIYSWPERDSRSGELVPNGHTYQLSVVANAKETIIVYAGKEGTKEIRLPGRHIMLDKINQGQERRRGWDAYNITNELHLRMNAEGIEPQVIDSGMTKVDNLPGRDWFVFGKEKVFGRVSFGPGLERIIAFQTQSQIDRTAAPSSQEDNAFLAELTPSLVQAGGQETPRLDVELLDGARGHFVVPAGTSTSTKEDKTTEPAIALTNIRRIDERATQRGLRPDQLSEIGQLMLQMDGEARQTGGEILGAQAKLVYQMSIAWALARSRGLEFYQFLRQLAPGLAPQTGYLESEMEYNLTNGGAHVAKRGFSRNEIDAQEFMVQPKAANLRESNQMADKIDRQLGGIYQALGLQADPGDRGIYVEDPTKISLRGREGGYSIPDLTRAKLNEIYQNVDLYADKGILRHLNLRQLAAENVGIHEFIINTQMAAIRNAEYVADKTRKIGTVALTLDVAASEFYENGFYLWEGERLTSQQLVAKLAALAQKYPILSIEDGMSEFDIEGWMDLIEAIGDDVWLIGDDVFATQGKLLWDFVQKMKERGWVDAQGKVTKKIRILIKLNQNGFLTTGIHDPEAGYLGTIEVMELAERLGVKSTVSHRSREPGEDQNEVSIAHVAAAFGADLKSGDHLQPARAVKEDELARVDDLEFQPAQWTGPSWTMEYHPETGITQTFTSAPDARSVSPIAEERGNTISQHQITYWRDLAATHEHATLADYLKTIKNQKVIPLAVHRAVEQSPKLTAVYTESRRLVDNAYLTEAQEAIDTIVHEQAPQVLADLEAGYGKTKAEVAAISGNKFALLGFEGDRNRLGWGLPHLRQILGNRQQMLRQVREDADFIRKNYKYVVFSGMGGSGLSVQTVQTTYGGPEGLKIFSLRTTDPAFVLNGILDQIVAQEGGDVSAALEKTMVIVISKSGATQETRSHKEYFQSLYQEYNMNDQNHFMLVTDPNSNSPLEREAQEKGYRLRYLQLNGGTDIGGRFTSPTTMVFLLPLALVAPENIELILERALAMNDKSNIDDDIFAQLGVYLQYMAARLGKDKVTFLVPDELRDLPMWSEQLFEESLGKAGKGVTVVYRERLNSNNLKPGEKSDRVFVRFNIGGRLTQAEFVEELQNIQNPVFDINVDSINDLGGIMLGLQRAIAVMANLWDINFVDQPGVDGYKQETNRILEQMRQEGRTRVDIPATWWSASYQQLQVYYTPFIEAGIATEAEIEAEVRSLGAQMSDGAAVYAALLNIARRKGITESSTAGLFEVSEIASYGRMTPEFRAAMEDARAQVFTNRLQVASKLGEGPDKNHSYQQNVADGKNMFFSTYFMPEVTTQPGAWAPYRGVEYSETALRAQTLGTVQSLVGTHRKVVLIGINGQIAGTEGTIRSFFNEVDNFLATANGLKGKTEGQIGDQAMLSEVGGINLRLNPVILDFQIKRDGNGIPLPINQQPIGDMKIEGFIPIYLYQKPISLPLLLSSLEEQPANSSSPPKQSQSSKTKDPLDLGYSSPLFDPKKRFSDKVIKRISLEPI